MTYEMSKELIDPVEKFAIGQRCFLLSTEAGNILWDMISLLDDQTIKFVSTIFLMHHKR